MYVKYTIAKYPVACHWKLQGKGTRFGLMNGSPLLSPCCFPPWKKGVLRLILNRARARNALSSALMAALKAALDGADASGRG